jgi:uncharacterized protein (DUF433 family)
MDDEKLLGRIVVDKSVMVGKPVIKGTRLTVEFILNLLAHGSSSEEIISEYNGISEEDVSACILFASKSLENCTFFPLSKKVA